MDVVSTTFNLKLPSEPIVNEGIGQRIMFNLLPGVGYTLTTHYEASVSLNASFKRPHANFSSLLFIPTITSKKQFIFPLTINFWTKQNKYNFVGEMHLFKYPQSTFGLGTKTLPSNEIKQVYNYLRIHDFLYKHIYKSWYIGLGIHLDRHWNIKQDSASTKQLQTIYPLGITNKSFVMGYSINFLYDNRTNSINPEKGTYFHFHLRRNLTGLGSDFHSELLVSNFKHYIALPKFSKNVLAIWSYTTFLLKGNLPYLDLPSTAWDFNDRTGRGYLQGRFRGKNWLYNEIEYRFGLTRNGLLGGVIFANAQSFTEPISNRFELWALATGAGLRVKLNKHSRTNIAIDYAFGSHGSHGFFIDIGEVF